MEIRALLMTALWALGIWIGTAVLALAVVAVVIGSLPADVFQDASTPAWRTATAAALLRRVARNAAGVLLIAAGLLLSIPGVPGQGLITVLVGLILLDIPGRHRVACAFARRPGVLAALNRIRRALRRPPLSAPRV